MANGCPSRRSTRTNCASDSICHCYEAFAGSCLQGGRQQVEPTASWDGGCWASRAAAVAAPDGPAAAAARQRWQPRTVACCDLGCLLEVLSCRLVGAHCWEP